ncbi:MAG TPA: ATP-binding protein [Polyangium sp.]|nr:ATP-binding protein [Polyangium sp.]
MYRNSSSAENRKLEYPDDSPGKPVPHRNNYARHGILATALLLGLTLVLTTWFAWRDAEALTDTVSEGQGELYLRGFHDLVRVRPSEHAFRMVVETYAQSGLRGAGRYDFEGNFQVVAGTFQQPLPSGMNRPPGRFLARVGDRYRIIVRLPPGGPPGDLFGGDKPPPPPEGPPRPGFHGEWPPRLHPDHGGHPPFEGRPPPPPPGENRDFDTIAFEFEPLLAMGLTQRARTTFFLATGVAALLALAAVVLWRRAAREESLGARLAQAERLASLGTMSAVLAHEIKNPLASLKGNAQLLAESLPIDGRSRAQADRVVEATLRLQGLVQNLLDFARGGPIERVDTDPAELLFLAAEDAAPAATLDLDHAPPMWSLDAIRMRQVLENLLRNALQASKNGAVTARVLLEGDQLAYTVEDDGPGFPPDTLENIFEPFFTTKSRGVGLGLAVARRIVVMHGGTLRARNKDDGGAEVKVLIPRSRIREESGHGADSGGG